MIAEDWPGLWEVSLAISRERTFGDVDEFEEEHPEFSTSIREGLSRTLEVEGEIRSENGGKTLRPGLKAKSLNVALRPALRENRPGKHSRWTFEADAPFEGIKLGAIVDSLGRGAKKTIGFDFASYDRDHNLGMVRALLVTGRNDFIPESKQNLSVAKQLDYLCNGREHWLASRTLLEAVDAPNGWIAFPQRKQPTVVGEIQAGNWALATQDIAKLGLSEKALEYGQYLYVTPDGLLDELMSGGTVNFEGFCDRFDKIGGQIQTPVRVMGLDVVGLRRISSRTPKGEHSGRLLGGRALKEIAALID